MLIRIIKLVISTLFFVGDFLYCRISMVLGRSFTGRCVILYYHEVKQIHRSKFAAQLDDIVKFSKIVSLDEKMNKPASGSHYIGITFDDGFECIIHNALPELLKRKLFFTVFIPTEYIGKKATWLKNRDIKVMNAEQLLQLSNCELATIGSHCSTHQNLLLIGDENVKLEIIKSKRDLEDIIQKKVNLLSFPHGAYSQKHLQIAQKAGYRRAYSILPKLAFTKPSEYVVGRIRVDPTDWTLEFRLKMIGAYRWLPLAFIIKHKIKQKFQIDFL